jgi:carbonic anhydrase
MTDMSDPLTAWNRLRAGNQAFSVPIHSHPGTLAAGGPAAAVFRCADADVASEMVFGQSWGSLLNVSTWGHVIDTGTLATMEYAVDTLKVPLIVILGHDDCAAMRTAKRAWDEAVMPDGAVRTVIEQALSSIVRRGAGAESVDAVTSAHIVETGLALLERSPLIARRVEAGSCGIVCASTDPVDGHLRIYATIGAVGEGEDSPLECV